MKDKFIIRECDINRIPYWTRKNFDEIVFTPITKDWLQKRLTWHTMKGHKKLAKHYRHWPYPAEMLKHLHDIVRFYNPRYLDWGLVDYDDQGQMRIRAGIDLPVSVLGFVEFITHEKTS